jgi:ribosomal protein L29
MKKDALKEIKTIEIKELVGRVTKAKQELAGLVLDQNQRKLADVRTVFKKRKELAQMLTILRQKELLAMLELVGTEGKEAKTSDEEIKNEKPVVKKERGGKQI